MIVAGVLVFVGAVVASLGSRRVGQDPHCADCEYNLSGFDPSRPFQCPECGNDNLAHVRAGQLVRAPMKIWVGRGLMILGVLIGWQTSSTRLLDYVPDTYLPLLASWEEETVFEEAQRRVQLGRLSSGARDALVAHAIHEFQQHPLSFPAVELVAAAAAAGRLTPAQTQAIADAIRGKLIFKARSPVGVGQRCRLLLGFDEHLPLSCEVVVQPTAGQGSSRYPTRVAAGPRIHTWTTMPGPLFHSVGSQVIQLAAEMRIGNAKQVLALEATTEVVLPEDATVQPIAGTPTLDQQMVRAIKIRAAWQQQSANRHQVNVAVEPNDLPCNVAFQIYARVGQVPFRFRSTVTGEAGSAASGDYVGYPQQQHKPTGRTEILLLPSPRAAASTYGIHEIWAGALLFRDPPAFERIMEPPMHGELLTLQQAYDWIGSDFGRPEADSEESLVDWAAYEWIQD